VSGIRTEPTLGNEAREGPGGDPATNRTSHGRPRAEGGTNVRPRRERSPDGPHRHDRQEGCLDRSRDPLPTRVDLCPPLPADYHDALDGALTALGITLSDAERAAIDGHVRLLLAWNDAINLTAIREPVAIATRHVVDSLTGLAVLRARRVDRFVDLGSGGGFPGIPLAVALPADRALLIDSIGKKVRFLATAVAAIGLDARVASEAVRAETLALAAEDRGHWPAVTARAVAPLAELAELALPLLRPGGILVAWKRGDPADPEGLGGELSAARLAVDAIDPGGRIEVVRALRQDAERGGGLEDLAAHQLVVIERGQGTIAREWPRDPAARRRSPW
jgi:16S rRNA (guanine527-N7)-methyltransferase